jgi:putative transposase
VTLRALCAYWGIKPQAHHGDRQRQAQRQDVEEKVLAVVRHERKIQSELGGRKLHHLLPAELKIGRDRFFALLRERGLLIEPKKKWVRTTDSQHGLRVYRNLLGELELGGPHQLQVSDITYVATRGGFLYLALVTDAYSRKIVGYDLSASLSIEGAERALRMALKQVPAGAHGGLVHHSDQGVQYCSHRYTEQLRECGVRISMADVGNPYQNAIAERVNGILKQEYHLDAEFADAQTALRAVRQAISLYNTRRPHMSLGYRTPAEVHVGQTERRAA